MQSGSCSVDRQTMLGLTLAKALDLQGDKAPMQLRELYQVGYV